jgi:hypothetical protein
VTISSVWRSSALVVAAIAILFAVRDMFGYKDANPITSASYDLNDHLWGFVRLLMVAVGAMVAWRGTERPQARMLAGALIGLSLNNNWWFYARNDPLLWPSGILNYLGIAFGLTQFIRFAASYGAGDWRAVRKVVKGIAPFLGIAIAVFGLIWWYGAVVSESPQPLFNMLFWVGWDAANVLIVCTSLVAVFRAAPDDRRNVSWMLGSFSVAALGTAVHGLDRLLQGDTPWANYLDTAAQIALPVGLGYALLRRRALDVDFVVSRAALFGLVTMIVGACFSLAEGEFSSFITSLHLGQTGSQFSAKIAELGVSLVVAVSYKSLDKLVDRVLERFRGSAKHDTVDPADTAGSEAQRVAELERRIQQLEAAHSTPPVADRQSSDKRE